MKRKYPSGPILAVGVLCVHNDRFVLIRRGQEPLKNKWTVPGGVVEIGESLRRAAEREVHQECHIHIELDSLLDIYEHIDSDENGDTLYHYVIIEYLAYYKSGTLAAGSDSRDARWFRFEDVETIDTTDAIIKLIDKAMASKE